MGKTLSEKVWDAHVVRSAEAEPDLLYIDLHLVHEVTSPQAFDGLRQAGRPVRRPDLTIATEDHNTPTLNIDQPIADPVSRTQVDTLRKNAKDFGVRIHSLGDLDQGVARTRQSFVGRLRGILGGPLDDSAWDEIEETLIAADLGADGTGGRQRRGLCLK